VSPLPLWKGEARCFEITIATFYHNNEESGEERNDYTFSWGGGAILENYKKRS